jgi:hypothetical protein
LIVAVNSALELLITFGAEVWSTGRVTLPGVPVVVPPVVVPPVVSPVGVPPVVAPVVAPVVPPGVAVDVPVVGGT